MSEAREKILAGIKDAQAENQTALPVVPFFAPSFSDNVQQFNSVLTSLGGTFYSCPGVDHLHEILQANFPAVQRVVSLLPGRTVFAGVGAINPNPGKEFFGSPHSLENVDLAIIEASFAVAENGAVWISNDLLNDRILPFITQHLVVVVNQDAIIATMHEAYQRLATARYSFGTFIAGPSKTADIEQSLVLGAHGARTMTVISTSC